MTDQFSIRGVIKRTAFLRSDLTVRVDPPPLHHLRSAFYEYCFGVCLTLDYDYVYYETDFDMNKLTKLGRCDR